MATFLEALKDMQENGAEYECNGLIYSLYHTNATIMMCRLKHESSSGYTRSYIALNEVLNYTWTKVEKLHDFAAAKAHLENGGKIQRRGFTWTADEDNPAFLLRDIDAKDWRLI